MDIYIATNRADSWRLSHSYTLQAIKRGNRTFAPAQSSGGHIRP